MINTIWSAAGHLSDDAAALLAASFVHRVWLGATDFQPDRLHCRMDALNARQLVPNDQDKLVVFQNAAQACECVSISR
jgi:hypothetical protein